MKKNNKGFSLVELIVVIAIMAVLVGVLAPTLLRYVEKARVQKDASAVSEVAEAIVIACANETVYNEISGDGDDDTTKVAKLTMSTTGAFTNPSGSATTTELITEVQNTVGTYAFASSSKEEITFKITKTVATGIISVEIEKVGETDAANVTSDWAKAIVAAGKH